MANNIDAPGTYLCEVVAPQKVGWYDESLKGTPFIRIPLRVIGECPQKGQIGVWQGYLTERAKKGTKRTLDDVFGTSWTWSNLNFGGKHVEAVVEEEEYKDKMYLKVRYINAPGRNSTETLTDEEKLARSKAIAKRLESEDNTTSSEQDDIPF